MEGQTGPQNASEIASHQLHRDEYLTFMLGGEAYGLDILKVQEIRNYEITTKIANTPESIKGVVDLRGVVVPIVDLRVMFGLQCVEYNNFTVVIILNLSGKVVGIVVDGVSDVKNVNANQIREVPDIVASIDTKYITGLATIDERMLILVNIEQLMSRQEFTLINTAGIH